MSVDEAYVDLGGIVARAYIEADVYSEDRAAGRAPTVTQFVTLGTPHAGAVATFLGCRVESATGRDHPGVCLMPYGDAATLNSAMRVFPSPRCRLSERLSSEVSPPYILLERSPESLRCM